MSQDARATFVSSATSFFFFFKQKTAYEISACLVGSAALLVLLICISVRLLPERRRPPALLALIGVVVLGKFFGHELILGQVNLLFGVLAGAAFLTMRAGNESAAGVLLALTVAIKPYGLLFMPS